MHASTLAELAPDQSGTLSIIELLMVVYDSYNS